MNNFLYHVLIVDDEPHVVEALSLHLQAQEDLHLDLQVAYRGQQAIQLLSTRRIDLVITDIQMPDMSGLELMDAIASLCPMCKVVVLTGYPYFNYALQAMRKRAVGFILKNESNETLIGEIRKALLCVDHELNLKDQLSAHARADSEIPLHVMQLLFTPETAHQPTAAAMGFEPELPLHIAVGRLLSPARDDSAITAVSCIFERLLAPHVKRQLFARESAESGVWCLQFLPEFSHPSKVNSLLETVQASVSVSLGLEFSLAISPSVQHCALLPASYKRVRRALGELPPQLSCIFSVSESSYSDMARQNIVDFVRVYVDNHITGDISLVQLSESTGYNPDYLSRIFRASTGITIGRYISQQKLLYCTQLLSDTSLSLEDIARMSGFASRSYFNRFIKKETNMTPNAYRAHVLSRRAGSDGGE